MFVLIMIQQKFDRLFRKLQFSTVNQPKPEDVNVYIDLWIIREFQLIKFA